MTKDQKSILDSITKVLDDNDSSIITILGVIITCLGLRWQIYTKNRTTK